MESFPIYATLQTNRAQILQSLPGHQAGMWSGNNNIGERLTRVSGYEHLWKKAFK